MQEKSKLKYPKGKPKKMEENKFLEKEEFNERKPKLRYLNGRPKEMKENVQNNVIKKDKYDERKPKLHRKDNGLEKVNQNIVASNEDKYKLEQLKDTRMTDIDISNTTLESQATNNIEEQTNSNICEGSTVECRINDQSLKGEVIDKSKNEKIIKDIIYGIDKRRYEHQKAIEEKEKHTYSAHLNLLVNSNQFINVGYKVLCKYDSQLRTYRIIDGNEGVSLLKEIFYKMGEKDIPYDQYNKMIKDLMTDPRIHVSSEGFYRDNLLLNCKNGILDLTTMSFIQDTLYNKYYFRVYLGVNYIQGFSCYDDARQSLAPTMPYFNKFISTSLGNSQERTRLIFEIIGYCLSNIKPFKKILICQGANDSGKSLIMKFLTTLLTEYSDNNVVATLSLAELSRKFSNQLIESAKLVCGGEIDSNSRAIDLSMIKKITGGDSITVEKKFCNPRRITPHCKMLFNTNEPLNINGETTYAMIKRIHTLKFPVSIPESKQDLDLLEHVLTERDQIVTIAIWALKELIQRKEFTKDPEHLQLQEQYISQIPEIVVDKFINENLVINEEYFVTVEELQKLYSNYCHINDYVCLKNNRFIKLLKRKLHPKFDVIDNKEVIRGIGIGGIK